MGMVIDNKFNIAQTVYLKTDPDQNARIVTAIQVTICEIIYQCACGTSTSWHYDFEISDEVDTLKKVG